MLGGRVEGRTIKDGMPSRRDELTGKVRVNLRIICSGCTPVEQVVEICREADVLRLADLVTVAYAEVRLHEPRCAESARAADSDSTRGRILRDVEPLSAACDKRREGTG